MGEAKEPPTVHVCDNFNSEEEIGKIMHKNVIN